MGRQTDRWTCRWVDPWKKRQTNKQRDSGRDTKSLQLPHLSAFTIFSVSALRQQQQKQLSRQGHQMYHIPFNIFFSCKTKQKKKKDVFVKHHIPTKVIGRGGGFKVIRQSMLTSYRSVWPKEYAYQIRTLYLLQIKSCWQDLNLDTEKETDKSTTVCLESFWSKGMNPPQKKIWHTKIMQSS